MSNSFEEIRKKANLVRNIDLEIVLERISCKHDNVDKAKWYTCVGVISVTGPKFMNWTQGIGGGGAIDLVIHLMKCDFKAAVFWLSRNFSSYVSQTVDQTIYFSKHAFKLPKRNDTKLKQIIDYLRDERCIPVRLINFLLHSGKLYADSRANAVFLLLGKEQKIAGAELRGTGHSKWRGMAPGSRKDLGFFFVKKSNAKKVILCESAIDAISYFALKPNVMALSTSGANPKPSWLPALIEKGFDIYCGFDSDTTGDSMAKKMIAYYPSVKRLSPTKHDWNEDLQYTSYL